MEWFLSFGFVTNGLGLCLICFALGLAKMLLADLTLSWHSSALADKMLFSVLNTRLSGWDAFILISISVLSLSVTLAVGIVIYGMYFYFTRIRGYIKGSHFLFNILLLIRDFRWYLFGSVGCILHNHQHMFISTVEKYF
jgi:hypothetical protein